MQRIILLHNTNIASLSPDQKAQVLTIDAAAHTKIKCLSLLNRKVKLWQLMRLRTKKQYELLPLEKKARLMETRAKQCHEHLTEEEKKISAQIRSVAATFYEKVDLD